MRRVPEDLERPSSLGTSSAIAFVGRSLLEIARQWQRHNDIEEAKLSPTPRQALQSSREKTHAMPNPATPANFKNHHPNVYRTVGGVTTIDLTDKSGAVVAQAFVDADMERAVLFSRRWRVHGKKRNGAYGSKYRKGDNKRGESLGRLVMDAQPGQRVRYRDGNGLNCRRSNLELVGMPREKPPRP